MRVSAITFVAAVGLAAGCDLLKQDSVSDAGTTDVGGYSDPNCHIDCFGYTPICEAGVIYESLAMPVRCPEQVDYPLDHYCRANSILFQCRMPTCRRSEPMERYGGCLYHQWAQSCGPVDRSHLVRVMCGEDGKRAGDPCAGADDCRPAAADVAGRLTCDAASGTCREEPRPAAPPEYGGSCGLGADSYATEADEVVAGKTCDVCHAMRTATGAGVGCVAQACTIECQFDEDCPSGSYCTCTRECPRQFCVAGDGSGRYSETRTQWLKCPAGE